MAEPGKKPQTPEELEGKDSADAAKEKYFKSDKGKKAQANYAASDKGKEAQQKYHASPRGKLAHKKYYFSELGQETYARRRKKVGSFKEIEKWLKANPGKTIVDYNAMVAKEEEQEEEEKQKEVKDN